MDLTGHSTKNRARGQWKRKGNGRRVRRKTLFASRVFYAVNGRVIVILIPSHFEAKDFLAGLEGRRKWRAGMADCFGGRASGEEVVVGIIGMGPPHAAKRAEAVIENAKSLKSAMVRGVILCGFAGALNPELKRGEIFVTAGAEHFLRHLPEGERPAKAMLHTADKVAATGAAKAELFARTGAALVDMEQADIARVVAAAGLPFVGVRIVSDEAHEDLPHDLLSRAYNQARGEYTPLKLAGHLTRNPFRARRLASFVRPLPPVRKRMSDHLHRWLKLTGPKLFRP
jgi:nucleoside phosphorylase